MKYGRTSIVLLDADVSEGVEGCGSGQDDGGDCCCGGLERVEGLERADLAVQVTSP